ncbi:DEAD/DEAH box helicase [Brevibacillus borstelensis]|uniref:DEAD/DEAH box helicase n=1 Tax=Brevibacillus borstelensis TaxID=45462 RepID=UPI002E1AF197|nr:DEAD/DEAH box helicase [Brevibacillus borstelensis]MED2010908.1 DEAD/DEAH box helicase [Brevibacillus borstelensis]
MFDVRTSMLLSDAPSLSTLDARNLPLLLTRHYTELVSARLKNADVTIDRDLAEQWPLERIADVYETVASIEEVPTLRRAAAFVAGSARLIISRGRTSALGEDRPSPIDRDSVDSATAAALLFLAAEQFADAFEAVSLISKPRGPHEVTILGEHIKDLASGKLNDILARATKRRSVDPEGESMQDRALRSLAAVLAEGIELLAAHMMSVPVPNTVSGKYSSAQAAFLHVIELSFKKSNNRDVNLSTAYAGPAHLASLLLSSANAIEHSALTKLPPPNGANEEFWGKWLRFRANDMPFLWQNHREAIEKQFYQTGQSAVLVLPTGAGKTTVSVLKIAGTLARGKKVVFLVPTHALVEQLTEDLQAIFPKDQFGLDVSSDFDSLLMEGTQLQDIEVMTPERCLAMLSFTPTSFESVGLLVFDECHILSPKSGKIRRSLDAMLCLLAFHATTPEADLLFLSAMLKNGQQFADWITELTGRPCNAVDLLWKPSRQARGVLVYQEKEIDSAIMRADETQREMNKQKGKNAKGLREAAKRELTAIPHVVWGLKHNWLPTNSLAFTKIMDQPVQLTGKLKHGRTRVTPNANEIAANIAIRADMAGLKTIVFVNTKDDAVSTSRKIANNLEGTVELNKTESDLWESLNLELGHSKHSIFGDSGFIAVPHNASMLRLERMLSERLFRRKNGAKVIVATPTLAQGLNLPAHLAILAGDKRTGEDQEREALEAHELLNAAARAGRAGHLANGVVILIPEPIVTYTPGAPPPENLKKKLLSVLPEDDRCVTIIDPLEVVLDRISEGKLEDHEVRYTINRLAALKAEADAALPEDFISRSFGAFLAMKRGLEESYVRKVEKLWDEARAALDRTPDPVEIKLASQSGIPLNILERLRLRLLANAGHLPTLIGSWVDWTIDWLIEDTESRDQLLQDVRRSALLAVGKPATSLLNGATLISLRPGIQGWISGRPINEIERMLGGDPEGKTPTEKMCPRARELVSTFIPRGLSFIMMVVSRMVEELDLFALQEDLDKSLINSLSSAVRKGFDSVEKLEFANVRKNIFGRVQLHMLYAQNGEEG